MACSFNLRKRDRLKNPLRDIELNKDNTVINNCIKIISLEMSAIKAKYVAVGRGLGCNEECMYSRSYP